MLIRLNWTKLDSPIVSTILTTSPLFLCHILNSSHLRQVKTSCLSSITFTQQISKWGLWLKLEMKVSTLGSPLMLPWLSLGTSRSNWSAFSRAPCVTFFLNSCSNRVKSNEEQTYIGPHLLFPLKKPWLNQNSATKEWKAANYEDVVYLRLT